MKKNDHKIKKILVLISIFVINALVFMNSVYATSINSANLQSTGSCGELLTYKGGVVIVSYVQYTLNGVNYPAYCMDPNKPRGRDTKL